MNVSNHNNLKKYIRIYNIIFLMEEDNIVKDIFSKIRDGELEGKIVYKNEFVTAFHDKFPSALVHILIIPNEKYRTLNDIDEKSVPYLGNMLLAASRIAKEMKIDEDGYRAIINCNKNGGQEIFYLHMHLVGGFRLGPMLSLPNDSKKKLKKKLLDDYY